MIMRSGFTFDDVLLTPVYSEVASRSDVNLKTYYTRNIILDMPIVSSNMDTITESTMMAAMLKLGGVGILHRFLSIERMVLELESFESQAHFSDAPFTFSVGVDESLDRLDAGCDHGAAAVCLDVAHGDHSKVVSKIKEIVNHYPYLGVIAGNVATGEGAMRLMDAGAAAIKVGIGPGSLCTTRVQTGCGVPQLSAIMDVYAALHGQIPIIADGGIRSSGDIVKALAAGADTVMLGGLLAGTQETPGRVDLEGCKSFRGMASSAAQTEWKGEAKHVEGWSSVVKAGPPVGDVVKGLLEGVRSGFSYCGAKTVDQLRKNAVFIKLTDNSLRENHAHYSGK